MKGVIFVDLIDFLETRFGIDLVDAAIQSATLPSGGAYTSVGTYDAAEVGALIEQVSQAMAVPVPALLQAFGEHLFGRLAAGHPTFLAGVRSPLQLLRQIEGHIHVEVLHLYPDAQLPRFTYEDEHSDEGTLWMVYHSRRGLVDLCEGLIRGCCAHYGRPVDLHRTAVVVDAQGETAARLQITLR